MCVSANATAASPPTRRCRARLRRPGRPCCGLSGLRGHGGHEHLNVDQDLHRQRLGRPASDHRQDRRAQRHLDRHAGLGDPAGRVGHAVAVRRQRGNNPHIDPRMSRRAFLVLRGDWAGTAARALRSARPAGRSTFGPATRRCGSARRAGRLMMRHDPWTIPGWDTAKADRNSTRVQMILRVEQMDASREWTCASWRSRSTTTRRRSPRRRDACKPPVLRELGRE